MSTIEQDQLYLSLDFYLKFRFLNNWDPDNRHYLVRILYYYFKKSVTKLFGIQWEKSRMFEKWQKKPNTYSNFELSLWDH